jgi:hypothetical protein
MSQPRGRSASSASKPVRAGRGDAHAQRPAIQVEGQWAGDVGSFVDWCEGTTDLDAYRAALVTVPPHDAWHAVARSLRAEIEFTARPDDSGPRARVVETFRTIDPDGAELRAAKRKILEAEITRRAIG